MSEENIHSEEVEEHESSGFMSYEELMESRKISFSDVKEHLTGPVISTIVHIVLLAFLGTIIVFEAPKKSKEIQVEMKVIDVPEIKEIPEPPEPVEVESEVEVEIERPDVVTDNVEVTVEDVAIDNNPVEIEMPNVLSVKPSNSALVMPALFSSRSGDGRKSALKSHGGSNRTEQAVLKGLRWLKDHQNPDGSWGNAMPDWGPGYTGLALLAFLAHGDTPSSAEFGNTVKKAIEKLVDYVGPSGTAITGKTCSYTHAIAMYALSEAYALTKIPMLEGVVNAGITRIIKSQDPMGTYRYHYSKTGEHTDLSIAGWNYQAMKAAFAGGCTSPGLETAIDKAVNIGLKKTHYHKSKKMFSYTETAPNARPSMTAVGTLCLQLFGEGNSAEAKGGLDTLENSKNFWIQWGNKDDRVPSRWSLYQWYYQTQAMFQGHSGKGAKWRSWNKMFTTALLKNQKKDGRWETPLYKIQKGGENSLRGLDQPVYATALCCLMLEVYYRYLPTFKVAKIKHAAEADGEEEEDLGLSLGDAS